MTPVGSNDDRTVDVRAIAATSRKLEEMVKDGRFREDLYYRLNVVTIHLPALRERREDIPLLTAHFLKHFGTAHGKTDVADRSESDGFPGKLLVAGQRAAASQRRRKHGRAGDGDTLTIENLPASLEIDPLLGKWPHLPSGTTSLVALQRSAVEKALVECNGHRTRAAESLGISVRTLQRKLKAWGLEKATIVSAMSFPSMGREH